MPKRLFFLILTLLLTTALYSGAAQDSDARQVNLWPTVDLGNGIKPAIAIDPSGVVHVAWITEAMMGGVFYANNASGEWETTQVSAGYFYGPVDIAVSFQGLPFIAYHDHQAQDFDPALGDEVVAMMVEGRWTLLTIASEGHDGWDNSIAVDADGYWHTASVEPSQFGTTVGVEYATNATGLEYAVEEIGSGPVPYEFHTSIAIQSDGTVGISYFNDETDDLMYAERAPGFDGTWTLTTVDSEGDVGRYASLAYDSADNPHIAYFMREGGASDAGTVRYTWRDSDGEWQSMDVGTLTDVNLGMVGARKITAIAIDSHDGVHLMYGDRLQIVYAQLQPDGTWTQQVVAESQTETGNLGSLVEFALDADDTPHLVYYVVSGFSPLTGEIIYATPGD